MKVGDLVRPKGEHHSPAWAISAGPQLRASRHSPVPLAEEDWVGIIIGWDRRGGGCDPIVMWSERFPDEVEYVEQLEVINETR